MAKAQIKLPTEFLDQLEHVVADDFATPTLQAGAEIARGAVAGELERVIGHGTKTPSRSTGQLAGSLGVTQVRVDRKGDPNVKVGFAEPRADGVSNAKIAAIIEYGTSSMPARPFLKPAKVKSRTRVIAAMKRVLTQRMKSR